MNSIRLDVEAQQPIFIHDCIRSQIDRCFKECMPSLYFITALPLHASYGSGNECLLLHLETVTNIYVKGIEICVGGCGLPPINRLYVVENFAPWLTNLDNISFSDPTVASV